MIESRPGFCDYPPKLKIAEGPITCPPRMRKGFKDKGNCSNYPKVRGPIISGNFEQVLHVEALRQRNLREI